MCLYLHHQTEKDMKNLTTSEIKATLAQIKNVAVSAISALDVNNGMFNCGKSVYMFELTKSGLVKTGSVKFLFTISAYNNCSY